MNSPLNEESSQYDDYRKYGMYLLLGILFFGFILEVFIGSPKDRAFKNELTTLNAELAEGDPKIRVVNYSKYDKRLHLRIDYSDGAELANGARRPNRQAIKDIYKDSLLEKVCQAELFIEMLEQGQVIEINFFDKDPSNRPDQMFNLRVSHERCHGAQDKDQ
ncbi:hypothetical protein [Pseudoalteromonas sp. R3]|uniref:hypothetical protein n=1 Tax=Pseudoalteromonas sp. R3 TaxID=1709477 RepID=UPI0006B5A64B|nr:hypothetical protein [Pseudoalteromonas sp. R3]AZZ98136.1 hypothetical protein ELR70_14070 [Pseudoalteromonas sp. R3]